MYMRCLLCNLHLIKSLQRKIHLSQMLCFMKSFMNMTIAINIPSHFHLITITLSCPSLIHYDTIMTWLINHTTYHHNHPSAHITTLHTRTYCIPTTLHNIPFMIYMVYPYWYDFDMIHDHQYTIISSSIHTILSCT